MSVPKSKRTKSHSSYLYNALKLREDVTKLLLRDFGIKKREKDLRDMGKMSKMSQVDKEIIQDIYDKYGLVPTLLEEFPEWLISTFRTQVMDILSSLVNNLCHATRIHFNCYEEYMQRREYLNSALGDIDTLYNQFQYMLSVLPIDVNKLMPYVGRIEELKSDVKNLRHQDNKQYSKLQNNSGASN